MYIIRPRRLTVERGRRHQKRKAEWDYQKAFAERVCQFDPRLTISLDARFGCALTSVGLRYSATVFADETDESRCSLYLPWLAKSISLNKPDQWN